MQTHTSAGIWLAAVDPIRCVLEHDYEKIWVSPVDSEPSRFADAFPPIGPIRMTSSV